MAYPPSKYQQAIYDWVVKGSGNAIIQAVAGSGKTTTIINACSLIPSNKKCLFVAFNKSIAEELKTRLPPHVQARTLHSLGLSTFKFNTPNQPTIDSGKVDVYIENEIDVLDEGEKGEYAVFLRKIIPLIKNMLVDYTNLEAITDLMEKFSIEFDVDERAMEFIRHIMAKNNEAVGTIDFDDMIYLPVVKGFRCYPFDWVFVDEAQDLNKTQFELIKKFCSPTTRVVAVGDKRQSIYAFRGADTGSMDKFQAEFKAEELPLSICYRCPKSHILLAQEIVPEIEYAPNAIDGAVKDLELNEAIESMQEKDLVLCRTNAPLVKVAFSIIRQGKKAVVRGRDIGKGLLKLVDKYKCKDIEELSAKLEKYRQNQEEKLSLIEKGKMDKKKKGAILANLDTVETLTTIMEDCEQLGDIKVKIEQIFSDDKEGIVCSSVHRAKGLEASNVYLINREMMPHPMAKTAEEREQEENILYVALTRARKELCLIKGLVR